MHFVILLSSRKNLLIFQLFCEIQLMSHLYQFAPLFLLCHDVKADMVFHNAIKTERRNERNERRTNEIPRLESWFVISLKKADRAFSDLLQLSLCHFVNGPPRRTFFLVHCRSRRVDLVLDFLDQFHHPIKTAFFLVTITHTKIF